MFEDSEYEPRPQDEAFKVLRIAIGMVAEYGSLSPPAGRLAWSIQDLRSAIADLVDSLMEDDVRRISKDTRVLLDIVRATFRDL